MLSLARTSLSLSRILWRTSLAARFNSKTFNPIRSGIAKNLTLVSFYTSKDPVKFDKKENVTSIIPEEKKVDKKSKIEEKPPEQISITSSLNSTTILSTVIQAESTKKDEDANAKSNDDKSWKTMKYTFTLFGVTFTIMGLFLVTEFGAPTMNQEGEIIADEYSDMSTPMQYIYRTIRQMNYYRKLINEPSRDKLLPDEIKYPYHQPPYTLVLEFKDVLVHPDWTYGTGWRFKKRPGIDQFLEMLNGVYEIVIYTAELGMTVFPILEALDPNNHITYKLVRDATYFIDGHHVKDLDKLNRNLTKVILVDWDENSVQENRDNVLKIPRWDGTDNDTTLLDLANFLRVIAISEIEDVRDVLKYYSQYEDPIATFKEKQRELERTMYAANK